MKALFLLPFLFAFSIKPVDDNGPGPKGHARAGVNRLLMLQLVNKARTSGCQCGDTYYYPVAPVQWNDLLEKAATAHSNDMASHKFFSHIAPDGSRGGDRIAKAGYSWMRYGENIGMGYENEREMVEGWLKSPGHCKNIMGKDYKEMGVAKVGDYWTQEFASK